MLEEHDAGQWRAVSARLGEADEHVRDLMGMSADQFYQVVLLPQGQFAQFLHADAEDRAKLLQKLFGTDRFRQVEEWLADRRRTTARDVEQAEMDIKDLVARVTQVAGVPPPGTEAADDGEGLPPEGWAAGLAEAAAAQAAASEGQVSAHRIELERVQDRQRDAERLADRQRRRTDALRTGDQLAQEAPGIEELRQELAAALRGGEVTPALEEAERTAGALHSAYQTERQARAAVALIPQAREQATAAELRAGAQRHVTNCGRLDGLRSLSEQAAAEDETAASARAAAAALAAQIAAAEAEAGTRYEQRPKLSLQRDRAREAAERLPGVQAEAGRYRRAADDMAALVQARADAARQEEGYFAAKLEYLERFEAASRLRRARIDGMRAELAAALVDGAPCPVCGSLDHPELCELQGERVTREQ